MKRYFLLNLVICITLIAGCDGQTPSKSATPMQHENTSKSTKENKNTKQQPAKTMKQPATTSNQQPAPTYEGDTSSSEGIMEHNDSPECQKQHGQNATGAENCEDIDSIISQEKGSKN